MILSAVQFLYNRSLWLDEASLALNIISKSHLELLQPLDHGQVAPIAYLQITKLFYYLTPNAEYGLRLLPLICFWGALILFRKSLHLLFRDGFLVVFALSLFALNPTLMYFSSEVKQYMPDVFLSTLIIYLVIKPFDNRNRQFFWLGFTGVVAIWFSNIAPILLLTAGLFLFSEVIKSKWKHFGKLILPGVIWLVAFGVYYRLFIHDHPTREFMISYWSNEGAFMPGNIFSTDFFLFFKEKIEGLGGMSFPITYFLLAALFVLCFSGLWMHIKQRNSSMILLLISPIIIHLVLSSMQLYPFGRRLILYAIPFIILLLVFGIKALTDYLPAKWRLLAFSVLSILVPVTLAGYLLLNFPKQRQEIKQSIQYIQQNPVQDQELFVHPAASSAFMYYKQTGLISDEEFQKIHRTGWANDPAELFSEHIQNLEKPYWLLFSHDMEQADYVIGRLQNSGSIPKKEFQAAGTAAYLFNAE